MPYIIYTDGACSGNPGPGGWGLILADPSGHVLERGGGAADTTNNRMELIAIIESLKLLKEPSKEVHIYSDSSYSLKGITQWRAGWIKKNWVTSAGKPVANVDLWKALGDVLDPMLADNRWHFHWHYVPGHKGIEGNERADEIACSYSAGAPTTLYDGPLTSYKFSLEVLAPEELPKNLVKKKTSTKSSKKAFGYISLVNGEFNFDSSWKACEARVKGRSGARFKKVFSEEELHDYRAKWTS